MTPEQREILEYVGSHWWMYRCDRDLLGPGRRGPRLDLAVHNAAAHSSLVHARALADFFYDVGQRRDTDWTAEDLGMVREPLPEELGNLRTHVNKWVVHITRGTTGAPFPDPFKVEAHLRERIDALKVLLGNAIRETWIGNLRVDGSPETLGGRPFSPHRHAEDRGPGQ
jgi:hypothetical protein